jgi:hypothetical protein
MPRHGSRHLRPRSVHVHGHREEQGRADRTATVRYTVAAPPSASIGKPTPRVSALRVVPRAFQAATAGPTLGKSDAGTTIRYHDSLGGRARFVVLRCMGKHTSCKRLAAVGSFSHRDRAGANRLHFTARLHGRALRPGRYVLRVTVTFGGQRSSAITITFTILSPPASCRDRDHDGDCDAPGQL